MPTRDILVGIPYWKGCHYVHFSQTKTTLHVLVGLPWWKGVFICISTKNWVSLLAYLIENGVTMCNSANQIACPCWSTLVKGRHCAFFAKENCVSLLAYPIEKGVTMCIFFANKAACFYWPTLSKAASLCAFFANNSWPETLLQKTSLCAFFAKELCMSLLAYLIKSGVTMCIFAKNSWPTLLQKTSLCAFLQKKTVCPC